MGSQIVKITAEVTVKLTVVGLEQVDNAAVDLVSPNTIQLELVSTNIDPLGDVKSGDVAKGNARLNISTKKEADELKYTADIKVNKNFGKIGAILVANKHQKELYLKTIVLRGLPEGIVEITCESWLNSMSENPERRIFFTNKSYLPLDTPDGLKSWRERELKNLRGTGQGKRMMFDRIYDYDVYNDLGDPDNKLELARPVLGGMHHPYPRRCRSGRPRCLSDPLSETRKGDKYVPRDEVFADVKKITFSTNVLSNVLRSILPSLQDAVASNSITPGFMSFGEINELFHEGIVMSDTHDFKSVIDVLPNLIDQSRRTIRFPTPDVILRDQFAWFRDEEFARETLAGPNPCSIKLVTEWPLMSKLDPEVYGPPESEITSLLVEKVIRGMLPFDEALEQKKLFMLDYHDILLPYVNKVRMIKGTTLYGSRTLFFLTPEGTLKPIAIELTRPPTPDGKPQWKQVYTPSSHATGSWLWRFAKAHVLSHDSAHHQVVSHWLRTHCSVEPYIIATNRQLSAIHPIYRLMSPYFRYTMEINSLARDALINANGIIETTFSTDRYSMEFGSTVYDQEWRFDHQALPLDLISRGMAVEDESYPHGLKLAIEDYPYANDGLLLWDAIKQWVMDYVTCYYQTEESIESDYEIRKWWTEIKNKGHEDKKDELWWPILKTPNDLVQILTNMIWVTSGHHAAVNFGQYTYGGYFPNRPTIARIKMPSEDPVPQEWANFVKNPLNVLLRTFPSRIQGTKVTTVLNVLSTHSPDEEYIGDQIEPSWSSDPITKGSFDKFHLNLKKIEGIIDARNADVDFNNRNGIGVVPYELLKPSSKAGVTGMGVPNSISI